MEDVENQLCLYHRTSKDNIQSILREGLLIKHARSMKCIYLSKNNNSGFGNALFRVMLDPRKHPESYELSDWEVICFHDIDPEYIMLETIEHGG